MPQPDFEQCLAAIAGEVHQPRQVVQLVEAVFVEVVEELARPDRLVGHLEVVDPRVPVVLNRVDHNRSPRPIHAASYLYRTMTRSMVRDLRRLADTRFDLVIVGAGFYGAIAAWDATLRGLVGRAHRPRRLRRRRPRSTTSRRCTAACARSRR